MCLALKYGDASVTRPDQTSQHCWAASGVGLPRQQLCNASEGSGCTGGGWRRGTRGCREEAAAAIALKEHGCKLEVDPKACKETGAGAVAGLDKGPVAVGRLGRACILL